MGFYQQGPLSSINVSTTFGQLIYEILCKYISLPNLICLTPGKYGRRKLPILGWLPQYCTDWAVADMIAGVTVGLTIIPQVMESGLSSSLAHYFDLIRLDLVFFVYFFFAMMLLDNMHPGNSLRQYRRSAPPVRSLLLHHGLLRLHSIWQVDILYHW